MEKSILANENEVFEIVLHPSKRLREVAKPIKEVSDETVAVARKMLATMHHTGGVGLAATQVGIAERLIVLDVSENQDEPLLLANPQITGSSDEQSQFEEGCLSIPGVRATVTRPKQVSATALDVTTGEKIDIEADELLAVCLQHEIDHLDGVLFIDHLSRLKRRRVLDQYKKLRLEQEAETAGAEL